MLRYCPNLKAIRYESTSLKRFVGDKSRVLSQFMKEFCREDISVHTSFFNIGNVGDGGNQLPLLNLNG